MIQTIGVFSGLVMKVVSAATGTLARQLNASSAATATCANGTMIPMIMPRATPRGTDRRVKRHSSGARIRFAKGERKRFARKLSCVGMFRSEEHTSELQSLMRLSYAVFCLNKKN